VTRFRDPVPWQGFGDGSAQRGYLVRSTTLDDLVREPPLADQLGTLRTKLSHYRRPALLDDRPRQQDGARECVICADEKSQQQALGRRNATVPARPGERGWSSSSTAAAGRWPT
jgi:hypothetical protein